jgi:cyclopropane-fatty-acyl-phospholipid synthase
MATLNAIRAVRHPVMFHALDELLVDFCRPDFRIRLWDGTTWDTSSEPRFTLILNDQEALRVLLVAPTELSLGEAYIAGAFDVEGDLNAAFELGDYLLSRKSAPSISHALFSLLRKLPSHQPLASGRRSLQLNGPAHSKVRDQQAIHYHYDLPPDFFALWLDRHMLYSCAYFAHGRKYRPRHSTRKQAGIPMQEAAAASGRSAFGHWLRVGGLLVYAATHYGSG